MVQEYYHYAEWEDYINGMWRKVSPTEEKEFLQRAIKFTSDHSLYGEYMMKAVKAWPIACRHNLTDVSQNRRAWVGHAAVCIAIRCPEYITREAWGQLTKEQQDEANAEADKAIAWWESNVYERKLYAKELFE